MLSVLAAPARLGAQTRPADSAPTPTTAPAQEEPKYKVSRFELAYDKENPGHIPIEKVAGAQIELGLTESGFVAPRPGVPVVRPRMGDLGHGDTLYASASRAISVQLVQYSHRHG